MSSDIRLLFTSLVSLGHCIFCPLIYDFSLPLWYLLVIVLSVLWYTISVHLFGIQRTDNTMTRRYQRGKQNSQISGETIQWPRDAKEVNRNCISEDRQYDFCLPLWYLLVIVLSVLLFTSLVSIGHCIIRAQTIQWPRDTKEVNSSRRSEDKQYNDQEIPKR
jgi:predicted membrane channel-forming protein YqfA (hemolysin III family)